MAVTFVQSKVEADVNPFITDGISELAFNAPVASGNVVCVAFGFDAGSRTVTSVTDNGGNTYALVPGATAESTDPSEGWIYASKTTNACQTVTITLSSAVGASGRVIMIEFGSTSASPIEDGMGTAISTPATTHSSGDVTLAAAGGALFGFCYGSPGTYTVDAAFTEVAGSNHANGLAAYRLDLSAQNYSMTTTSAGNETTVNLLAAITALAGGGGTDLGVLIAEPLVGSFIF